MSRSKAQAAKNSAAANAAAKSASVDQAVPVVADSVMAESQQEKPNSSSSSSSQPSTLSGSRKRGRDQGARRGEASQEDDQIGDSGEAAEAKAWEQDLETHESSLKAVEALSLTDKAVGSFHSQGAWNMTDRSPAEQPGSRDLGHGSSNIGSSNNNGSSDNHRLQPPSQPFPVDSPEVNDRAKSWEDEPRIGVSSLGIAVAAVAPLPAKGEDESEDSTMREQGFAGSGPRAVQAGVFADGGMATQSPAQTAPPSPPDAGRKLALSFLLA
ncbi:hypothetical protein BGW38_006748 [Lunasporangiospora selenospora]|uniref:Uncharacterized protein n=1 Tax=Lunasporangiospora selenospora TaxID=979761 RepID=A0A9P6FNB9_9FUNG|nr:hypothetical protein BGW38_006748 [Lunasporangiospora selenospora]